MSSSDSSIVYQRKSDLIATDMDGDTVMMSIERGEYYGIGGVGSRVWVLLQQAVSIDQIVTTVCSEFEVEKTQCQNDMQGFVAELLKMGLVEQV
jgi:hypothetical protein